MTEKPCAIESFEVLTRILDNLFAKELPYDLRKEEIEKILRTVCLTAAETSKYTFFDSEKPYTRNLAATDGKNYTLLVLCWTPGKESKIHNHPCDGCFIKTLVGCVKETRYDVEQGTGNIVQSGCKFFCEGQVSYMCDDMGLHKVGNPCCHTGAVTLHLYTPPFKSCKVWSSDGEGALSRSEVGIVGFYTMYGTRTPHQEGKPGLHARMLIELMRKVPTVVCSSSLVVGV